MDRQQRHPDRAQDPEGQQQARVQHQRVAFQDEQQQHGREAQQASQRLEGRDLGHGLTRQHDRAEGRHRGLGDELQQREAIDPGGGVDASFRDLDRRDDHRLDQQAEPEQHGADDPEDRECRIEGVDQPVVVLATELVGQRTLRAHVERVSKEDHERPRGSHRGEQAEVAVAEHVHQHAGGVEAHAEGEEQAREHHRTVDEQPGGLALPAGRGHGQTSKGLEPAASRSRSRPASSRSVKRDLSRKRTRFAPPTAPGRCAARAERAKRKSSHWISNSRIAASGTGPSP
jgi:hypothetical protein